MDNQRILNIVLKLQDQASKQLETFGDKMESAGVVGAKVLAGAFVAVGAAATTATIYSLKAASDFQEAMTLIQTQAGASAQEIEYMTQAVLQLAPAVGQSPQALAEALFYVESAGLRGANALEVLKLSAEEAAIGHADLTQTADVLTSVINSGIGGIKTYTDAVGTMNAIVGGGKMKLGDLEAAIATGILPVLKSAGINFQQFGGALDVFTNNGVPAVDAASRLRMSISMMADPTPKAVDALSSIGLGAKSLANDMQSGGLTKAIQDLHDHMKGLSAVGQEQLFGQMFGVREGAAMMTLVQNSDKLKKSVEQVQGTSNNFGAAWQKTQEDAGRATQNLINAVQTLAVQYGTYLLPIYTQVVNYLASNIGPAISAVTGWWKEHQKQIMDVANVVMKNLVVAFQFFWFVIQAEFIPILDKLKLMWEEHHKQIVIIAEVLGGALMLAIGGIIVIIGIMIGIVVELVKELLDFGSWVVKVGKDVIGIFDQIGVGWQRFGTIFMDVINTISLGFKTFVNGVVDGLNIIIKGIDSVGKVGGKGGLNISLIPHLASGTNFFQGGLALVGENGPELVNLPRGSQVIPNNQINSNNRSAQVAIGPVYVTDPGDINLLAQRLDFLMRTSGRYGN